VNVLQEQRANKVRYQSVNL